MQLNVQYGPDGTAEKIWVTKSGTGTRGIPYAVRDLPRGHSKKDRETLIIEAGNEAVEKVRRETRETSPATGG